MEEDGMREFRTYETRADPGLNRRRTAWTHARTAAEAAQQEAEEEADVRRDPSGSGAESDYEERGGESLGEDYYALLEVDRAASAEEITRSYRRLARQHHPDRVRDAAEKESAQQRFAALAAAYEVLKDERQRRIYDACGAAGLRAVSTGTMPSVDELRKRLAAEAERQRRRRTLARVHVRSTTVVHVNAMRAQPLGPIVSRSTVEQTLGRSTYLSFATSVSSADPRASELELGVRRSISLPQSSYPMGASSSHASQAAKPASSAFPSSAPASVPRLWTAVVEGRVTSSPGRGLDPMVRFVAPCSSAAHLALEWSGRQIHAVWNESLSPSLRWLLKISANGAAYVTLLHRETAEETADAGTDEARAVGTSSASLRFHLAKLRFQGLVLAIRRPFNTARIRAQLELPSFAGEYMYSKRVGDTTKLGFGASLSAQGVVALVLSLEWMGQRVLIPVQLTAALDLWMLVASATLPLLLFGAVNALWLRPSLAARAHGPDAHGDAASIVEDVLEEDRRRAEAAVEMMKQTVERIRAEEEERSGLCIVEARYGALDDAGEAIGPHVDVTAPLQFLVGEDSSISIAPNTISKLTGFYDPCPGLQKRLYVLYMYRDDLHTEVFGDDLAIHLPASSRLASELGMD